MRRGFQKMYRTPRRATLLHEKPKNKDGMGTLLSANGETLMRNYYFPAVIFVWNNLWTEKGRKSIDRENPRRVMRLSENLWC